ncbi:hypothetical protein Ae201684P_013703 [Aphanomyces euteiches]|nr:hypothetical protein Ae201684P_013703 [Aphanomyces euteiches]
MKTCILSALVAAVVMAEDSPTMQSSEARRDMAAFRDHRPSHPVYIYAPHFTFHEDPTLRSYVDSTLVDVDRRDLPSWSVWLAANTSVKTRTTRKAKTLHKNLITHAELNLLTKQFVILCVFVLGSPRLGLPVESCVSRLG